MISLAMVIGTIIIFIGMTFLYRRFTYPLLLPILTTTIILVVVLSFSGVSYDTYMSGAKWIDAMLGPAVVGMAYPLYIQREKIIKNKVTIILGVTVAMLSGLISIVIIAKLMSFEEFLQKSLLPKSITSPIAMPISESIGGIPTLTAVFVILAGLIGALAGPFLFKLFHIDTAISRGISIGSASHGIGLSKLSEYGEETMTMGSVAMTLSAILGAFICPVFAFLIF
ncbi:MULTISPECIES: LrgB family protein [unclassified Psychrobacillus]|uniref:LrgB family protein n=1 Tax=unclassified Psychrobacillus TaxID=2636677 RepID=UPI00146C6F23|nr:MULTISPECIES: LrgB family protein [unclassified Psychrobacillus]MCM3357094.1 LrgB family protein [Psychrobacillus sp. MER TA 171]NME05180.1 LrgB family protein [Psychrobacillus sp. BL-248-WT-3]